MLLRFTQRSGCSPGRTNASPQRLKHTPSRLVMNTPSEIPSCRCSTMLRSGTNRLGNPMKMCGARKYAVTALV